MANADLDKQPDSVSSVLKVFGILQALGEEREIGITELSQRVMMSKSTVYRFLQTMKTLGYVAQEGESEKYSLTLKLFELGARALQKAFSPGTKSIQPTFSCSPNNISAVLSNCSAAQPCVPITIAMVTCYLLYYR